MGMPLWDYHSIVVKAVLKQLPSVTYGWYLLWLWGPLCAIEGFNTVPFTVKTALAVCEIMHFFLTQPRNEAVAIENAHHESSLSFSRDSLVNLYLTDLAIFRSTVMALSSQHACSPQTLQDRVLLYTLQCNMVTFP